MSESINKIPLSSVVFKTTGGGTPERDNPEFWNGGIPWASVKDFKDGIFNLTSTKEEISERGLKFSSSNLIPANTPIICTRMAVGRIARFNVPTAINQDLRALYIRDNFDTDFVVWAVDLIRHQIENLSIGSTVKGIGITQLLNFKISAPPKPEQTKIAEILSTVDRAIEQTEALIAKQQRIKTGLMQDLLTRGVDTNGNLRTEQTHEFKDSPLGRIPVEWTVFRLDNVADFVTSGSRGWARYYSTEGSLFLRIGNLTRHHINMRLDDLVRVNPPELTEGNRTSVIPGDLLISITADLGIIAIIPDDFQKAYVNQHIALIRLKKLEVVPRFVGWFLGSRSGQMQFEKLNESGAKAGLNLSSIKNLLIPKFEITEQLRIASILDVSTEKLTEFRQRLTKLHALKTALMQDLLTGRKRVISLLAFTTKN